MVSDTTEIDQEVLKALMQFKSALNKKFVGVYLASAILALWLISLVLLLRVDFQSLRPINLLLWLLIRTFFQTGLFIVSHDAMHQSLFPSKPLINDFLGRCSLALYAFLNYEHCRSNHYKHHHHPGTNIDPDFHDGQYNNPLCWYVKFMKEYLSTGQMSCLIIMWSVCFLILQFTIPTASLNIFVFWIIPLFLSSIQLFVFGTYLPHRSDPSNVGRNYQINSIDSPLLLSLLACYHFGYHREHHQFPMTPWYALPMVKNRQMT